MNPTEDESGASPGCYCATCCHWHAPRITSLWFCAGSTGDLAAYGHPTCALLDWDCSRASFKGMKHGRSKALYGPYSGAFRCTLYACILLWYTVFIIQYVSKSRGKLWKASWLMFSYLLNNHNGSWTCVRHHKWFGAIPEAQQLSIPAQPATVLPAFQEGSDEETKLRTVRATRGHAWVGGTMSF